MDKYLLQELAYNNGYKEGRKSVIESGTIFRLPCRVGDYIYVTKITKHRKYIATYKVRTFYIDDTGLTIACKSDGYTTIKNFRVDDIGVNVFLSRKEAEEVLDSVSAKSM